MNAAVLLALVGGVLALGLLVCLGLFLSLKVELTKVRRQVASSTREWERLDTQFRAQVQNVRSEMERLSREVAETGPPSVSPPPRSLNLNRRSQVLRMARRGEKPEQIASALSIPQNEVDLLLKVHQATQPGVSDPAPVASPAQQSN